MILAVGIRNILIKGYIGYIMTDLTQEIARFGEVALHGTFTGILRQKLSEQKTIKRKNYFGVTDICNPLQTFFKLKYPEKFVDSIETKKKFSLGNKQHKISEKKFEKIEGFVDKEIILDGELLGIPLKGRADAKINQSLWELKSKEDLPRDINSLIEKYPQDIEQLSFYSLLDPSNPVENYLIFTTHLGSNNYKAFKLKILDLGKIKNLALTRIKKLNDWLNDSNLPDFSYKCRYCNGECIFKEESICNYFDKGGLPCEVIRAIEITDAPEIEEMLSKIELFNKEELVTYSIYNLITARKVINAEHSEILEEEYEGEDKRENKYFIQDLIYKLGYGISSKELENLKEKARIKELYQNKSSFIKFTSNGEEKIFPLLIHISDSIYSNSLNKVSDYKKSELGIHCLNNGFNKGYLIVYFPKQNNEIRVFEMSFNFDKELINKLKNIVEILKNKDKDRIKELNTCPSFIHEHCAFKEICPK